MPSWFLRLLLLAVGMVAGFVPRHRPLGEPRWCVSPLESRRPSYYEEDDDDYGDFADSEEDVIYSRSRESSPSRSRRSSDDGGGIFDNLGNFRDRTGLEVPSSYGRRDGWRLPESVSKSLLAGVFVLGVGLGVTVDSQVNTNPKDLASRDAIDNAAPNPTLCASLGASAMAFDQRVFVSFNPFNVYVSQADVKPACVLRPANVVPILKARGLINDDEVRSCKQNMNTWAFVGSLDDTPQLSCVYQSRDAQNEFLSNPKIGLGEDYLDDDRYNFATKCPESKIFNSTQTAVASTYPTAAPTMLTMEEYSLISYGTGGSDPRSNYADRIPTTTDTNAQVTRISEVIRVEFTRPTNSNGPQPSIMTRLRTVLNKMLSMGFHIIIKSNVDSVTSTILTPEELSKIDTNSFFQRIPDKRTSGNFPDKVVFVLETSPGNGLAAFKRDKEFREYLRMARVHLFVNEHKTFYVKIVGYLFKKSPGAAYIPGIKKILEQYVNKKRSAEDKTNDYAFIEVDARITVPQAPRNTKNESTERTRLPSTLAIQIRCETSKHDMVRTALLQLRHENIDQHLLGQFVPHLSDDESQATLAHWVLEHNKYSQELSVIRISGLHPEVLEEPLFDNITHTSIPVISLLYDAMTPPYSSDKSIKGPIAQERLIDSIEPTRSSPFDGQYLVITTQAKREAALEHVFQTMNLVRLRSTHFKHHSSEANFANGITIPQTGFQDPALDPVKDYLKAIAPISTITTNSLQNERFMHYNSRKPTVQTAVFDDGVSNLTEFSKLELPSKPATNAAVPTSNAWFNTTRTKNDNSSVNTDSESIASSINSMQSTISHLSGIVTGVQRDLSVLKSNDDRREAAYARREVENQNRHAELLRQQQDTATILERLMIQSSSSRANHPDSNIMPPPTPRTSYQQSIQNRMSTNNSLQDNTDISVMTGQMDNASNDPYGNFQANHHYQNTTYPNHYHQQLPPQPIIHHPNQQFHHYPPPFIGANIPHSPQPAYQHGPTGVHQTNQGHPNANNNYPTTTFPNPGTLQQYPTSDNTELDQMSVALTEDQSVSTTNPPPATNHPEGPGGNSGPSV